jgi:GNAT superfamily N-acetyltransferase
LLGLSAAAASSDCVLGQWLVKATVGIIIAVLPQSALSGPSALARTVEQFRELLVASRLGERRPMDEPERLRAMLKHATLLVTAWEGDLLLGVSRCLCDFTFANYCSDLAVRESHQRLGIGRELLRLSLEAGGCKLILLSAPKASTSYSHIGPAQHPSAWTLDPGGPG